MVFFSSSAWNILYFNLCPLSLVLPHRRIWLSLLINVCLKGKLNLWVIQVVPKYSVDLCGSNYCGSVEVTVDWDEFIDKSVMRSMLFLFWLRKEPQKNYSGETVLLLTWTSYRSEIGSFSLGAKAFISVFVPWRFLFLVFCHVMWMCILLPPWWGTACADFPYCFLPASASMLSEHRVVMGGGCSTPAWEGANLGSFEQQSRFLQDADKNSHVTVAEGRYLNTGCMSTSLEVLYYSSYITEMCALAWLMDRVG